MLNTHQTHQDLSTQAKNCILNITYPSPDLYLVIRVEKVLQQGDISECADAYVKAGQQSQSSIEKLQSNAQQFCERLGKYRMPFVWTAINIMNILNDNSSSSNSTESTNEPKGSSLDRRSVLQQTMSKNSNSVKNAYESFRKVAGREPRDDSLTRRSSSIKEPLRSSFKNEDSESLTLSLAKFRPIAISINVFFKQESDKLSDEDLFRCLNDLKKSTNLIKKLKCVPGCLKLEFSPCDQLKTSSFSQNYFILSPELQLVKSNSVNQTNQPNQEKSHYHQPLLLHNHLLPVKDLLEFPTHQVFEPNYFYRNLLYIYPLAINLCGANSSKSSNSSNLTGVINSNSNSSSSSSSSLLNSSSARNIAIKVNLMKGEDGEHCALPVLFSKSSSTTEYCKEVFVNVVYHNKTPQYNDEIKIKLPALLNSANYHLLFTFYHVSCQNSKDQLDTVIGYSWLPLEQQFQYETTVQFINNTGSSTQPANLASMNIPNQSQLNDTDSSKLSSFTKTNRCQMIKSGVYSLPISFEKLPNGYSNLNYSIYDNATSSTSNSVSFFIPLAQDQSSNDLPGGCYIENKEEKIPISNIVSVNTVISNMTNTSGSSSLNSTQAAISALGSAGPCYSKSFFDLRLKLVSTIHTQDVYLENFIQFSNLYQQQQQLQIQLSKSEFTHLKQSIYDLCYVESETMVKFLNLILDKLFCLMLNCKTLSCLCFEIICRLVHKIRNLLPAENDLHKRNRLLVQYIKFSSNLSSNLVHEEVLTEWLLCLTKKPTPDQVMFKDILLRNSWFFFELIFKSLGIYLLNFKSANQSSHHTTFNFYLTKQLSTKFLVDLEKLIKILINELVQIQQTQINRISQSMRSCNQSQSILNLEKLKTNEQLCNQINCSLALFLNDLFSLVDRGFVFKLIDFYTKETNKYLNSLNNQFKSLNKSNSKLKFIILNSIRLMNSVQIDFLRILSSNENFLSLNLPIFTDLNKSLIIESKEYFHKHYLVGLILRQIFKSLHSPFHFIQFKAVQLFRNLLEAHDLDPRLANNSIIRPRIAYMYFPFVNLIIHFIPFVISTLQFKTNKSNSLSNELNEFDLFLNDLNLNPTEETDLNSQVDSLNTFDLNLDLDIYNYEDFDLNYLIDSCQTYDFNNDCSNFIYPLFDSYNCLSEELSQNFSDLNDDQIYDLGNIADAIDENRKNKFNSNNLNKQTKSKPQPESSTKIQAPKEDQSTSLFGYLSKKHCLCSNSVQITRKNSLNDVSVDLSLKTSQDLLICFVWIVKNIDKKLLFNIWSHWSYSKLNKVLILIDLGINQFEYRSTVWSSQLSQLESVSTGSNQSKLNPNVAKASLNKKQPQNKFKNKIEDLITIANVAQTFSSSRNSKFIPTNQGNPIESQSSKLKWRKDSNQIDLAELTNSYLILEGNLSTECLLVSLDAIELIIKLIQHQQQQQLNNNSNNNTSNIHQLYSNLLVIDNNNQSQSLLTNIMRILLNSLSLEQSTTSLTNLFCHQRALVSKFPELLFEEDTEYCSDLCMRLLKHCTSPLQSVRAQASASLYFLMRQNFDIGNNFSRVKMQVTMSLSTLVAGTKTNHSLFPNLDSSSSSILMDFYNVTCLKRSLKTILYYAESDLELSESSFPAQVKDLVLNLNTILSDTVKMRENQDDPEMLIDLMHRIANCYQNSPDMRLIWLQNMAQKHLQHQNLVEAGQCLVHAAALVAEYLSMIENRSYLPVGCASFKNVSVNVLEESAVSDDVLSSPFEEGICTGKYFTETGLIGLVEQAAVFLVHSQNYEVANQLYKILIPIYEAHRDIKKLSQVHSKLHDCFNKILLNSSKRLFGTYFRVGFYGEKFEDLNGEEFIYKEPGITKLAEIAHRLENFYTNKFGQGCVEIMKDSNNVDKNLLDLISKAYIQITYVEPYFDRYELHKCETFFEKNYSLKRFIYATPFTLDGKAHGPLNQQYKRKTILTTERAFPYVKTRIPVIDKQQIILGPVEVAVEDLSKKIDELKNATLQEPADPKILQMVLQGCVGTTVNQGPLEMAMTFLQPVTSESITEHHNKLRLCFKEFSRRCADALKKNKTLIGPDQYEYQREMERNYNELKIKIDPLVENKLFKNQQVIITKSQ